MPVQNAHCTYGFMNIIIYDGEAINLKKNFKAFMSLIAVFKAQKAISMIIFIVYEICIAQFFLLNE